MGKRRKKSLRKYLPLYIMALPGFLYLLINNYLPMFGIVIAFKRLNFRLGILGSPWAGLDNFEYLFTTPDAFRITRNTLCYNFVFIVINLILSVSIAIILSEIRSRRKVKVYQTVILLPYMISMVVVSYLVYGFLSGENGYFNAVLKFFGQEPISWYTEPKYWPFIIVFVNAWKGVGYSSIIYYATIMGIDNELYEAAAIDGAKKMAQVRYITIPLLKTTAVTLTLLAIGRIFYSDFGLFYQVTQNSAPLIDVTNTIDTYVFRGLMTLGDISMSSAAGVYQSLVGFVMVMAANWVTRKIDSESALF